MSDSGPSSIPHSFPTRRSSDLVTKSETDGSLTFTVSLSNPVDVQTKINVSFADDRTWTRGSARQRPQVPAASSLTTAQILTVSITHDPTAEATETFTASLALDA